MAGLRWATLGHRSNLSDDDNLTPIIKFGTIGIIVLASLLLVPIFNFIANYSAAWHPERALAIYIAIAVCCALAAIIKYDDVPKYLRIIIKGLALFLGFYSLWLGADFSSVNENVQSGAGNFIVVVPFIVFAATIAAMFRPSLALLPPLYLLIHKDLTRVLSGAKELGRNDYAPLVEVLVFTAGAVVALGLFVKAVEIAKRKQIIPERFHTGIQQGITALPLIILCMAVGAHLGNYFMSGLAKIHLDGGVFAWVSDNPTSSLMLAGYNVGAAPGAYAPGLFGFAYSVLRAVEPYLNVVTLAAQFLCFLAFLRVRTMLAFTVFFDMMHIAIFLLTGALFVPWILLNSLLASAFVAMKMDRLPKEAIIAGVLVTIMGHTVFYNARLGWYDSRELRDSYFTAITDTGEEYRVPNSFFRQSSYLMYTRNFGYREHRGPSRHVPTSQWGQIGIGVRSDEIANYDIMKATKTCSYHSPYENDASIVDFDAGAASSFIGSHHQMMLQQKIKSGKTPSYHLYPHHHYSMPVRYKGFEALNLENIAGYRYNVETVCLDWQDGAFKRDVLVSTKTDIIPIN
ncbi:hypothetical protein [Hyphomonas sp. UBA4494]|jgi:hypothetical protein|uniref:hypothetical protein n=1 Tax=Hyphomonas sp. UBA4494 TaxID=1946631 RepID=UPI0025C6CC4B|nr:hypothetical protein [Hyphomonas sp. UBA4494]